jgi:hypothetical protein
MQIAISGHQSRPGLDWIWTAKEIRKTLRRLLPIEKAYSSLAVGSDRIFAREALSLGVSLTAILPLPHYEQMFSGAALVEYQALLARCEILQLPGLATAEQSFLAAGQLAVARADVLIAVWDGEAAAGLGGTADIVRHGLDRGRTVIHLNPLTRTVQVLSA